MRFIKTNNSIAEFIETDKTGKIISSRGFQFGVIYFEIKNKKVAFYLDNDEQPFQNFVWSTDIPLTIDDVEYETEEEVSAALHSIFNDRFQEQLDQLKEDLAAEEARAQEAEAQLDDKIDDETSRAISAETHLQDEVTALSGTLSSFDERITRNTNDISALTNTVNAEIARSTNKDGEHDALISGLTASLNNEISRATSAETSLHNEILAETNRAQVAESGITHNLNAEIQNRIADVDAEEARALAAESALTDALNAEVTRSTAKDASHDAEISGLSTSLQNEINRAVGAENSLRNDLNAEIANRASGDTLLQSNIDTEEARALEAESGITNNLNAEIQNRINAVSGLTERVADDEASTGAALVDLNNRINAVSGENASQTIQISGLNASLNTEISRATSVENALRSDLTNETSARTTADTALQTSKADKVSAVASAIYNSTNKTIDFKNISGTVISSIDARDFIKDGMVDTVTISNNNLVITFNTDAGKEDIVISLASIFDPNNYYTKSDINAYSASVETALNSKASQSDLSALSGDVITISSEIATISGNSYTKTEVDNKLGNKTDLSAFTAHTADTTIHFTSGEVQTQINNSISGKADSDDVYTKSEVDASQLAQDNKINAISGDVQTLNEKVETISGESVTSGEVESMINEAVSGKQDTLSAGTNIQINNNVISATDTKYTAGRGIAISTANTISFDAPIWKGVSTSIKEGSELNTASAQFTHAEGYQTKARAQNAHAEGEMTNASGYSSHAEGQSTNAIGSYSHSQGYGSSANGEASHAGGYGVTTNNRGEFASGILNVSTKSSDDNLSTLFSVGNGTANDAKHNAFEIKKNGDIYITSGNTDIKLQDHLGSGGGGGVTPTEVQTMIDNSLVGYQEELTAGTNVQISNNVISATDTKYTAGDGISISNQNVISTVTKFWCGTQSQYDAISVKDPNTVYMIHE